MHTIPLAEASSLQPFVSYLEAQGSVASRHLNEANVSAEMVASGQCKITKVQATQFLEGCREKESVPDLGYRVGEGFGPAQMGDFGLAIRRGVTLADSLDTFCSNLANWFGDTCAWVERSDDGARARLRCHGTDSLMIPRDVANQNGVFILIHVIRQAAGDDWTPKWIRIPRTPGNAHRKFAALANATADFSSEEIAVEFPAKWLAKSLTPELRASSSGERLPMENPDNPVDSLSEVLRNQMSHGCVPVIGIAAEMAGTSQRSLQRLLEENGLTYRRLLDRVRFTLAREQLLQDSRATVADVAHATGFSSPSSFIRSFRRMTGMTPLEFRLHEGER